MTIRILTFCVLLGFACAASCQTEVDQPVDDTEQVAQNLTDAGPLARWAAEKGQKSILDLVLDLGLLFIIPFAAFSIWAVYLILANLLILSESRLVPVRIARQARDLLNDGELHAVHRLVDSRSDLLSLMLQAGCDKAGHDPSVIEAAMEGRISQHLVRLRSRVRFLADIANITPMIGLLGTVWGLLKVFEAVATNADSGIVGNWSSLMSQGIAHAMVATVVGLTIAIPSLAFYALFRAKMARIVGRLETFGTDLAQMLSQQQVGPAPGGQIFGAGKRS